MFVVITLVDGKSTSTASSREGTATFSTPTVVHFCSALLTSAVLSAPWRSLTHAAAAIALIGLFGIAYVLRAAGRARHMTKYRPQLDDWIWYAVLPAIAYAAAATSALFLPIAPTEASFGLAGATMLLIVIGIRNAWDIVTYLAIDMGDRTESD